MWLSRARLLSLTLAPIVLGVAAVPPNETPPTELHRGTEAGSAWRVVIDVVAGVQIISALTGMLLWWLVPKWRPLGMVALAVCLVACVLVYVVLVP